MECKMGQKIIVKPEKTLLKMNNHIANKIGVIKKKLNFHYLIEFDHPIDYGHGGHMNNKKYKQYCCWWVPKKLARPAPKGWFSKKLLENDFFS